MSWAEFRDFIHGLLQCRDTRLWAAIQPPEQSPEQPSPGQRNEPEGVDEAWLMRDPPP